MFESIISAIYGFFRFIGYQHPLHPTQVHVPVGLVVGAFLLALTGKVRRQPLMRLAAWYCIVLALIFSVPTVITGLMDWRHFFAGALGYPFNVKLALAALLVIFLFWGVIMGIRNKQEFKGLARLCTACLAIVAVLGYLGGELVYSGRSATAEAQAAQDAYASGMALYASNCAGCHANGGNVMKPELPVKHSAKTADSTTFLNWVRKPKAPMPAYPGSALSDQEVNDIFEYVANVLNKS